MQLQMKEGGQDQHFLLEMFLIFSSFSAWNKFWSRMDNAGQNAFSINTMRKS